MWGRSPANSSVALRRAPNARALPRVRRVRPAAGALGVGAGRGCRNGDCIPPADEVFNGYKFAQPIAPGVIGRTAAPTTTSTSYKQGVPPSGTSASTAPKTGTVLESLKRNFSKP